MTEVYIFNSHTWIITSSSGKIRKVSPSILPSKDIAKNIRTLSKVLFSISAKKVELLTKKEDWNERVRDNIVWYDEVKDLFTIRHLSYRVYLNVCLRPVMNVNARFHYTSKFATVMMRYFKNRHRAEKCNCEGSATFSTCTYSMLKNKASGDIFLRWLITYIPKDNTRMIYEMMAIIHNSIQDICINSTASTPLTYAINWKQVTRSLTRCEVEISHPFSRAAHYLSSIRLVIPGPDSYISEGELRQLKYEVKDMANIYPSHWKRCTQR